MKRIVISLVLALIALLDITACGDSTESGKSTDSSTVAYEVTKSNGINRLSCKNEFVPVDIDVGEVTQQDGSSYSLKEKEDAEGEQVSVTLTIQLADIQDVPAIMVAVQDYLYPGTYGMVTGLYEPQLQRGSSLKVTLQKEGFGGGGVGDRITKVTACTGYLPTLPNPTSSSTG